MQPRVLGVGLVILLLIGVIWEVAVRALHIAPFLLPPPSSVISELLRRPGLYAQESVATIWGAFLGFALAALLGILIGTLIVYSWVLRAVIYPVILVLQTVPKVALAPLFIIWVGYGIQSRVVVAAIVAFFPVVMSTITGLQSVERDLIDLVRMLQGNRAQQFTKVAFPHAMPFVFSGLKVAATFAVIGEIVAEFISGDKGLGYLIMIANSEMNVSMSFAALIILSVIGLGFFALMELAERLLIPWGADEAEAAFAAT